VIRLDQWSEAEVLEFAGRVGGERDMERLRLMRGAEPQWEPEPPFRLENLDLLSLTGDELFPFAQMLQQELRRLREVLHVAVAQLAQQRRRPDARVRSFRPSPPNQYKERAANESHDSR
jgi:hypothetical protein